MEYKICTKCYNNKPIVQFNKGSMSGGIQRYRSACKYCRNPDKTFERLYIIPESAYLAKQCGYCKQTKQNELFYKTRKDMCKECLRMYSSKANHKYFSTDKGRAARLRQGKSVNSKLSAAKANLKRVEIISDNYIKQCILRHVENLTKEQIEFKRATIAAKRKLGLTHFNQGA